MTAYSTATVERPSSTTGIAVETRWLSVTTDPSGVVCIAGEIDLLGAAWLDAALHRVLATGAPLLLDLSLVEFIGSAGLGELVSLHDALDGRMKIVAASRPVIRVLDVTDLTACLFPAAGSVPR